MDDLDHSMRFASDVVDVSGFWNRPEPATVFVEGSELVVERAGRARRYTLKSPPEAWTWPEDGEVTVAIAMRSGTLSVRLRDAAEARALLSTLRVDPDEQLVGTTLTAARARRTSTTRPRSPRWHVSLTVGLAVLIVTFMLSSRYARHLAWIPLVLWCGIWIVAVVTSRISARVLVGRDGIVLEELGRKHFLGYVRIAQVHAVPFGVALMLTDDSVVILPLAPRRKRKLTGSALTDWRTDAIRVRGRRDALTAHIDAALGRFHASNLALHGATLERRGRTFDEWKRAIGSLSARPYRSDDLADADLLEILGDPRAPAEQRVGAALVLGKHRDSEVRDRIRASIDSCASPALRVALQHAADDSLDETTLERACAAHATRD